MISNAVFQVVIGTHVKEVYEEVEKIVQPQKLKEDITSSKKKNPVSVFIDFISGTFMPVIPAMSGAGMIKAVLALLTVFNIISTDSQTYYVLNFFSDAVLYLRRLYEQRRNYGMLLYIRENSLAISLEKKGFTLPNIRKDLILDKNEQDNYERMLIMLQSKRQIVLDKVHDEEQYLSELDYLIFNLRKLQK